VRLDAELCRSCGDGDDGVTGVTGDDGNDEVIGDAGREGTTVEVGEYKGVPGADVDKDRKSAVTGDDSILFSSQSRTSV